MSPRGRDRRRPSAGASRILLTTLLWAAPWAHASGSGAPADRAWSELLRGRHESALSAARSTLAVDPRDPRALLCRTEALHALGRAAEVSRPSPGERSPDTPGSRLAIGRLAHLRREHAAAERAYREALAAYQTRRDSNGILVASDQLAALLRDAGQPDEAGRLFSTTLRLAEARGRDLEALSARYGLAYTRIHLGRNDEARPHLDRALRDARRLDLPLWTGDVETLLAVLSWFRMDLAATRAHYLAALGAFQRAGHQARQAACLRNLGALHGSLGELPSAIEKLRQAQDMARRIGDRREESICLEHLGSMNHALGDDRVALVQWRDAARLGEDQWPPEWAANLRLNIGRTLWSRGSHEEAIAELRRGLAVLESGASQRSRAEILTQIARCLRATGRIDQALAEVAEARRVARRWSMPLYEAGAAIEEGQCRLARGELAAAGRAFQTAAKNAGSGAFHELAIAIHVGLARIARARGQREAALAELDSAIAIAEGVRRRARSAKWIQARAFEKSRPIYEEAIDLLHEMHRRSPGAGFDRRAFEVVQRAKARSFLDLLTEAGVSLRLRGGLEFQNREREILARIAALEESRPTTPAPEARRADAEIERLEDELATLESRLRDSDPRYAELRYPRPATLEEVQRRILEPGELLVEYLLGERGSYLWAVSRDGFRFHTLPGRGAIETPVRELVTMLGDFNLAGPRPDYFVGPARRAFQSLLAPAGAELGRCRRLIVAPDGILHYLPFETLLVAPVDPVRAPADFSSLPYLVLRADVCYVPSAGVLARLRAPAQKSRAHPVDLLAIGNPAPPDLATLRFVTAATGGDLRPLPDAAAELRALNRLYPRSSRVELSGGRATPAEVRAAAGQRRFGIVHFACHGVFNERRPQLSGLVLSPDLAGGDDGFLSAGEVFGLDLDCDLVVLSACASALGERVDGEGLVGLTRAFHYAGARTVVAALWEVSGHGATHFMTDYHRLMSSARDRAHALAEAKRRSIRSRSWWPGIPSRRSHPFHWAPFVLTGAPASGV